MGKKFTEKEIKEIVERDGVHTSNDLELKTELGKGTTIIISDDKELYGKMIQKFPKRKISKFAKKTGKVLTFLGVGISVITGGVLSWIGLPMAGVGAAIGVTGKALDDYKHYEMIIDYDNMRLIFVNKKTADKLYK